MASSATDPELGDFDKLPKELRLELYSYLLPYDFQQTYGLDPVTGIVNKFLRSSPLPALFTVSSRIHNEVLQSVVAGRTGTIWIEDDYVATNFPLSTPLGFNNGEITYADTLQEDKVQLPRGRKLRISIRLPSPKRAEDFLQIRRNVTTVVSWLNACKDEELPRMEVKLRLDSLDSIEGGSSCVENDFAMLMGPLARLQKPCISAFVQRNNGDKSLDSQSEHQCCLFENLLNGSADAVNELGYQQSILDIKLAIWIYTFRFFRGGRCVELDSVKATEIRERVESLRAWCKDYDEKAPSWLDDLERVTRCGGLPEPVFRTLLRTLLGRVFNGKTIAGI